MFKPNSEEFPFTIDIKDKQTGEAIIEVVRKSLDETKTNYLDCGKRRVYEFLIQAHDCSVPTLASKKYELNMTPYLI